MRAPMTGDATVENSQTTFLLRAAIGLAQGLALFALNYAAGAKSWPATEPMLHAPLATICVFVPLVAIVGLRNLRPRVLVLWTATAVVLCAGLATYDMFRDPSTQANTRFYPQPVVWLALAAGLFVAHSLIVAGNADRK